LILNTVPSKTAIIQAFFDEHGNSFIQVIVVDNASDVTRFLTGLSNGLSIGMIIVGMVFVVYGIAKYAKKD